MERSTNRKISFICLSLFSLVALTSCDLNSLSNDLGESIWNKLFPNIWAFLVQFLALVVLLIIVFKFAYKPVKKFINARKELLDKEVKETKEKNALATKNLDESKKQLALTKKEATSIIDKAKIEATKKSQTILDEAQIEVAKIKQKANDDIIKEKEKVTKELKGEIIDVAFDVSSKILSREVSKVDNSKIVDDFVDNLKDESDS